jgi:hypothetical protein
MLSWCARQYAKRIVNVNVNIVLAGLFAAVFTTLAVRLLNTWHLLDGQPHWVAIVIMFIIDMVFDVVIAVSLHWLANHLPARLRGARRMVDAADRVIDAAPPPISFVKDATTIQFQRLCISPVLYGTAWAMQWWLLHEGVRAEWTVLPAYMTGVLVARAIHTPWLLYADRKVWEQWEQATRARGANNLAIVPKLADLRPHGPARNGAMDTIGASGSARAQSPTPAPTPGAAREGTLPPTVTP